MILIDHTDPTWAAKCKRANGALTYSQDLVKYQVPKWSKVLGSKDVLSTCPKFSDTEVRGEYDVAVQYLHSFPYNNPIARVSDILWKKPFKANKLVFITAYKEFQKQLIEAGFTAVHIPMGIDVTEIRQYTQPKAGHDKFIYFGNIVHNKLNVFKRAQNACKQAGVKMDYISMSKFNGEGSLSREATLKIISTYKYGIGVGRCAQEMFALGLKVVLAGQKVGGLITNKYEYNRQLGTNMNGRVWTYSEELLDCVKNVDRSLTLANDIASMDHAKLIENELAK